MKVKNGVSMIDPRTMYPNLKLPVIAAPMFLVSGRTIKELDEWMRKVSDNVTSDDAPWVMNLITHSTRRERLEEELKLVAKYKPSMVITALGSPKPVMETVKSYGGLVFADVIDLKLARKSIEAGVDGLACISAGAGGHTGFLSPFAFISAIREFFGGYIAVGGGISDGAGVAGAIAAGADYVYMGTRFLPAIESMAEEEYKQMVIDADMDDLVISDAVTGTSASWLRPSLVAAGLEM